ncbi:hypothetical protein ABZV93_10815 [Actinopolymorpha sp. NPDC004070]|uniref:hypothetical protein n=1 Tax=Actinopolymorpha sp. NPDC004070 TaxID=3154548 RepID=UPI0033A4C746
MREDTTMFNPYVTQELARQHQQDLLDRAERFNRFSLARGYRRALARRRPTTGAERSGPNDADGAGGHPGVRTSPPPSPRPAGNLAGCAKFVAGPVR